MADKGGGARISPTPRTQRPRRGQPPPPPKLRPEETGAEGGGSAPEGAGGGPEGGQGLVGALSPKTKRPRPPAPPPSASPPPASPRPARDGAPRPGFHAGERRAHPRAAEGRTQTHRGRSPGGSPSAHRRLTAFPFSPSRGAGAAGAVPAAGLSRRDALRRVNFNSRGGFHTPARSDPQ